uniref:DNA/RNA-binding protein Alba-like domain-containing protein n=1 Tax=Zea mays TaxID=4577 RepID=A0A804LV93_MAIZE
MGVFRCSGGWPAGGGGVQRSLGHQTQSQEGLQTGKGPGTPPQGGHRTAAATETTHLEALRTVAAAGTLPQAVRQRAARWKLKASAPARTAVRAGYQGRQDGQRTVEGPDARLRWVDKGSDEVVFKAMGRAINKTVMVVELIKRRIVGLHQNTTTGSTDITDMWEPLEEGLLLLETTRLVSMITITLSKKEVDTSSIGYQSPLPPDEVKPLVKYDNDEDAHSPGGRGRGRSGRGCGQGRGRGGCSEAENGFNEFADVGWEDDHAPAYMGNGYACGRGRSFRGRGRRGGYNNQPEYQQDGGYYEEAPVHAPALDFHHL